MAGSGLYSCAASRLKGTAGSEPIESFELRRKLRFSTDGCWGSFGLGRTVFLFEAADSEDPCEAAEQHDGGGDGEGAGKVAGLVHDEAGDRCTEDAREIGETVLQADPSSGGFGAGEGLGKAEYACADDANGGRWPPRRRAG